MKRQSGSILSLLVLLAIVLSACAPAAPQQTVRPPLRVFWSLWIGDYTMVIAKEKGFFEKYGVQVEPILYEDYYASYPDLAEHKLDGAFYAITDMLVVNTITPLKAVMVQDSGGALAIISTPDLENIADLRGKRIGLPFGSGEELFVREMLYSAGLTLKDVQLVDITVEDVSAHLGKDIDAGYVFAPYDQLAVAQGNKILYTPDKSNSLFTDVLTFRREVIQERPEDIQKFINAWFDALDYRLQYPEESSQLIAEATGLSIQEVSDIPIQLYNRADNLRLLDPTNPGGSVYDITKTQIDFMNLKGRLTFPIDAHSMFDTSFVTEQ